MTKFSWPQICQNCFNYSRSQIWADLHKLWPQKPSNLASFRPPLLTPLPDPNILNTPNDGVPKQGRKHGIHDPKLSSADDMKFALGPIFGPSRTRKPTTNQRPVGSKQVPKSSISENPKITKSVTFADPDFSCHKNAFWNTKTPIITVTLVIQKSAKTTPFWTPKNLRFHFFHEDEKQRHHVDRGDFGILKKARFKKQWIHSNSSWERVCYPIETPT